MAEATEAIVVHQAPVGGAMMTRAVLEEDTNRRAIVAEYVRLHMTRDVDFGIIPGTPKPTLLKPGAEKLVDLFRCSPQFVIVKAFSQQDFATNFFKYTFRVRLVQRDSGLVLAEGFGSANSYESRYRWRNANRKCPSCGKDAIIKGKAEFGGGWLCFKKKDGCGQKFTDDDKTIVDQPAGRIQNEDLADQDNTVLKMAKKRALVDGAIALARCSDMFTQDMDDDIIPEGNEPPPEPPKERKPSARRAPQASSALTGKVGEDFKAAKARFASENPPEPPPPCDKDMPPPADPAATPGPRPEEETHVQFGGSKGKAIIDLLDPDLGAAILLVEMQLKDPKNARARWLPKAEKNLAALMAERDFRASVMKQEQSQEASNG